MLIKAIAVGSGMSVFLVAFMYLLIKMCGF